MALDFAPDGWESNCLSLVVSGAVLAALVGPEVARHTRYAMQPAYTATYLYVIGLAAVYCGLLIVIEFHRAPVLAAAKAAAKAAAAAAAAKAALAPPSASPAACKAGPVGEGSHAPQKDGPSRGAEAVASEADVELGKETSSAVLSSGSDEDAGGANAGKGAFSPAAAPNGSAPDQDGEPSLASVLLQMPYIIPALTAGLAYCAMAGALAAARLSSPAADFRAAGMASAACLDYRCSCPRVVGVRGPLRALLLAAMSVPEAERALFSRSGMMTATPLAIGDAGYDFDRVTQVIQVSGGCWAGRREGVTCDVLWCRLCRDVFSRAACGS